ncbi:MAG TPA: hypothetical protein VFW66_14355 [Gemmatimonadales bacterium]|nr:hypothetical protein [Gemmatimonadales bacterium]
MAIAAQAALVFGARPAAAQVQIRLGEPGRANYSELHEALREGTPVADTVERLLHAKRARSLWPWVTHAINGTGSWDNALVAFTRIAMLRDPEAADSARKIRRFFENAGPFPIPNNPGVSAADIEPSVQAVLLERRRAVKGDSAVLADILARIPTRDYNHGDAWVLGRLSAGARDSVVARFLSADSAEFRVRYLTLLSYFTDPALIPLLTRVYVSPDSFKVIKRYAVRASDGLVWIGTRESLEALLDARARVKARGVYADSSLMRGGYTFLQNDSAAVIDRTGRWLTDWIARLPPQPDRSPASSGPDTARAR